MSQRPAPFILLPIDALQSLSDVDRKNYIEALRQHLAEVTAADTNTEPDPTG